LQFTCGQQVPFATTIKESTAEPPGISPANYHFYGTSSNSVPDKPSFQRHASFCDFGSKDINRWPDKVKQYLNCPPHWPSLCWLF